MSKIALKLQSLRFFSGCTAGLSQKTALLTCSVCGDVQASQLRCRPSQVDWENLLPSQYADFLNIKPSTLPEWLLALVIAIQREARDAVWQGRLIRTLNGEIILAIPYERPEVTKSAIRWALRHIDLWTLQTVSDEQRLAVSAPYAEWLSSVQLSGLSPNSLRFAMAAFSRQWPVLVDAGILHIGWGCNQQQFDSSFTGATSLIAARKVRNKFDSGRILAQACLPVPPTILCRDLQQALHAAPKLGWPLVVKPNNQDQGTAVVPGISDDQTLRQAFNVAETHSPGAILLQKHIDGNDYRLLVVSGHLLATTCRVPGGVVGDGVQTVLELLQELNRDPRRGVSKRSLLMRIELDEEAYACLSKQKVRPEQVLEPGRFVYLRRTANISNGGTAKDVSSSVHPDNRLLAVRAARIFGLDVAGVDFICPDISRSWREVGGAICEVNAQPGFRPHWLADPQRDINGEVLDIFFKNKSPRIPTVAITGTNGKSTTALILHHIWLAAGRMAGTCTTQGVWIGSEQITTKNLSGLPGARLILNDSAVEVGIFEMPRKGLIHFGHPCDRYDVAILLNIQDDHIGRDGIASAEQMAMLKAQLLERSAAVAVVNADDPLCLSMRDRSSAARQILVSAHENNPAVAAHCAAGGEAVFVRMNRLGREIIFSRDKIEVPLMPCKSVAASMDGLLPLNEFNAMFAAAAAWAHGLEIKTISAALEAFVPSLAVNPGRYNFIQVKPYPILLDYAHNPEGVLELCKIVDRYRVASGLTGKCRLVSICIGNSHRSHIDKLASPLAAAFDTFLLSNDLDEVLNSPDYQAASPVESMLNYFRDALIAEGIPPEVITLFPVSPENWSDVLREAIQLGVRMSEPGDMLVILADPYFAFDVLRSLGLLA